MAGNSEAAGRRVAPSISTIARRGSIDSVTTGDRPTVPVSAVPDAGTSDVGAVVLLDVREHDEWALGHAPGALHIPVTDIPARLAEIDPDAELFVVCRQGGRSAVVVDYLNQNGYEALDIRGGMVAWQQAGRALVRDGDGPATVY